MHLAAAYPSLACRLEPGPALQLHHWRWAARSAAGRRPARGVGERCVDPGVFAEAVLLRRKYAVMKDAARARLGEHTLNLTQPEKRPPSRPPRAAASPSAARPRPPRRAGRRAFERGYTILNAPRSSRKLAQEHGLPAKRTRGSIRRRVRPTHFRDALAAEAVVALGPHAFLVRFEADRALDVRLLPLGARRPEW